MKDWLLGAFGEILAVCLLFVAGCGIALAIYVVAALGGPQ